MIDDYTDYIYQMLYKQNYAGDITGSLDGDTLKKIDKCSRKIILSISKMINDDYSEVAFKWKKNNPHDLHAFELAKMFLASDEYDHVLNFAYTEDDKCDVKNQFDKFLKSLNKKTVDRLLQFKFIRETEISAQDISDLVVMVNDIYDVAESGFWVAAKKRINETSLLQYIQSEQLIVAIFSGKIIGCALFYSSAQKVGHFGMLSVDAKFRGLKVGERLIAAIESKALQLDMNVIQFEFFIAKTFDHPDKIFLRKWYTALGYNLKHELDIAATNAWALDLAKAKLGLELWEKKI